MLKKIIIFALVIIFSTTTAASCNPGKKKTQVPEVTISVWGVYEDELTLKQIFDNYEANNLGIKIKYEKKDYDEYEKTTLDALAAGKGPDIWIIPHDWVRKHYDKLTTVASNLYRKNEKDARSDLEIFKELVPDVVAEETIIDNKIYGFPSSIDTLMLYYNKEHFSQIKKELFVAKRNDEANLFLSSPNTWEDLIKMGKLLTQKDDSGKITRSGFALGTANINNSVDILTALMLQNNTNMVSSDRLTATFNLPITKESGEPFYPGTKALEFYTSFADPTKDNYMWNDYLENSVDAFMQGKVSMMINYDYQKKRFAQESPTLSYDTGPLPQITGATTPVDYADYWVQTVTKNSKNSLEAWKIIKVMGVAKRVNNQLIPSIHLRASNFGKKASQYQPMTAKAFYKGIYPGKVDAAFQKMIEDVAVYKEPYQKAIDAATATVTNLFKIPIS